MVYSDAKDETQAARGNQNISRNSHNPDCSQRSGRTSRNSWYQSIGSGGTDWKRRDFFREIESDPISRGGTLAQLITELEQDLAESEERVKTLRSRLQRIRSLADQLGEPE